MNGFMYRKVREEVRATVYGMMDEGYTVEDIEEMYEAIMPPTVETAVGRLVIIAWIQKAAQEYISGIPLVSDIVASVNELINKGVTE